MSQSDHANRLRRLAEELGCCTRVDADAAALLAGAAAIEAVEVARMALKDSVCMCEQLGRDEHIDVCAKPKALAALAWALWEAHQ